MTQPAVEIRGVVKRFAGHTAVRDLSLVVPAGAVYGLLGPNGAGKTTTIRMLLNIIAPDEGKIRIFGRPNDAPGVAVTFSRGHRLKSMFRSLSLDP